MWPAYYLGIEPSCPFSHPKPCPNGHADLTKGEQLLQEQIEWTQEGEGWFLPNLNTQVPNHCPSGALMVLIIGQTPSENPMKDHLQDRWGTSPTLMALLRHHVHSPHSLQGWCSFVLFCFALLILFHFTFCSFQW